MDSGFGANFWGFFVLAGAWCVVYFAWAIAANRRDEERDRHPTDLGGSGHPDMDAPNAPADDGAAGGEEPAAANGEAR